MKNQLTAHPETSLENVLSLIRQLSPRDRLKLFALALPELEREFPKTVAGKKRQPRRKSPYGLWERFNMDITVEDIDEARKEMWGNFPRTDIL